MNLKAFADQNDGQFEKSGHLNDEKSVGKGSHFELRPEALSLNLDALYDGCNSHPRAQSEQEDPQNENQFE